MEELQNLPNINYLKAHQKLQQYKTMYENIYFTNILRTSLDTYRNLIINEQIPYDEKRLLTMITNNFKQSRYNLKRVVNATGTIIHTNLGRSLYSKKTIQNIIDIATSYNNLEYNLKTMQRGDRYDNIKAIICKLTGCEDVIVVNNNAAAVLLTLTSLVANGSAIVSRGELIEIGGSFRVPEIMKYSNTNLIEVGTTNRTHQSDYLSAITSETKAILKVHTSNYKIIGFTSSVSAKEIATICKAHDLISIEDIGSGSLINLGKYINTTEPTIKDSINAGIDIVTFSGDKLLGGVQAGFIIGKKAYLEIIKKNHLLRSLRVDKLTLAAVEASMQEYLDEKHAITNIPTLKMICEPSSDVKARAQTLLSKLNSKNYQFALASSKAVIGGGSLPGDEVASYKIIINGNYQATKLYEQLHANYIPIVAKIENDQVVLDAKTLLSNDYEVIAEFFNE